MFNPSNSLVRGAADACLRQVFGLAYGDLVMGQDSLLITHLIDFANDQHIGDLYRAAEQLHERVGTKTLANYVAALVEHRDPAPTPGGRQLAAEAEQAFSQRREEIKALIATGPDDRGLAEKPVYTDAYGRATEYSPAEDDAYIHDRPAGGYDACVGEQFLGTFDRRWQAEGAITDDMDRSGFFPNVWLQDDHGGLTLLDATEPDFGRNPDQEPPEKYVRASRGRDPVLHTHLVVATLDLQQESDEGIEHDL